MKTIIYTIKCPETNEIVYVGKANNLKKRISTHIWSRNGRSKINVWIKNCLENGINPIFEVYKEVEYEDWEQEEKDAIKYFRTKYQLLNVASGGNEPECPLKIRQENGRKVSKLIHSDPKRKRLWYLKKELASYFKKYPDNPKIPYMRQELRKRGINI